MCTATYARANANGTHGVLPYATHTHTHTRQSKLKYQQAKKTLPSFSNYKIFAGKTALSEA